MLTLGVEGRLQIPQKHFRISLKAFFVIMRYVLVHQVLAQSSKYSIMSKIDNKLTGVAYFQLKDQSKLSSSSHVVSALADVANHDAMDFIEIACYSANGNSK